MKEQLTTSSPEIPFGMIWAEPTSQLFPVMGEYDHKSQQWSERDICSVTTWSRSTTTGIITDDPDEDKDD